MNVPLLPALVEFFGRLHPMVLHAPIGILIALIAVEAYALAWRVELPRGLRTVLVWMLALSSIVTAASGFTLSLEGGYDEDTVENHKWLGIGVAVCALVAALAHGVRLAGEPAKPRALYRFAIVVAALLVGPTGHIGASMTHGADFLFAPFRARPEPIASASSEPAPTVAVYAATIAPLLETRCGACHGAEKKKGGLVLTAIEGLREGGRSGPAFELGKPAESEIVRRMRLPLDDEEHMPPEGKPQPTEQEIAAIEAWIASGAPFASAGDAAPRPRVADATPAPKVAKTPAAGAEVDAPSPEALAALREAFAHVEPLAADEHLVLVDFAAIAPDVDDARAIAWLSPLRGQVADLGLARARIGAATLELVASMPNLRRLDLRSCAVDDEALERLRGHRALREIVLSATAVGARSCEVLASLPSLELAYLWSTRAPSDALERLRELRPDLTVVTGAEPDAAVLESEPKVELARATPTATPVNATCPVSGGAVDARFVLDHEGRTIGFCCAQCPKRFAADPASFAAVLAR